MNLASAELIHKSMFAILMLFLIFGGIKSLLLPAIVLILLDSFAFGSFLRLFNEAKKALRNNNEGSL